MSVLDEIKNTASGAAIINDWLGENGLPVEDWRAEARAEICAHCPLNGDHAWWDKVKTAVAFTVRARLRLKHRLGFRVSNEDSLGICKACGCVAALKVWTPIKHIKAHTPPEVLEKFPQTNCWIRKEIEAPE